MRNRRLPDHSPSRLAREFRGRMAPPIMRIAACCLLSVAIGGCITCQASLLGDLTRILGNPLLASRFSFTVGTSEYILLTSFLTPASEQFATLQRPLSPHLSSTSPLLLLLLLLFQLLTILLHPQPSYAPSSRPNFSSPGATGPSRTSSSARSSPGSCSAGPWGRWRLPREALL